MIRGAEAIVTFEDGLVRKRRVRKGYRDERIDEKLITQRTRTEAAILQRLEGIRGVPRLVSVEGSDLLIERIEAEPYAGQPIARALAQLIHDVHERGVTHADVSPKNILVLEQVYLIDYGLSSFSDRIEDRAYDLFMTHETFSAYAGFAEELISAYRELLEDPSPFDERIERIGTRGRHKKKGFTQPRRPSYEEPHVRS
ncbi:MAG: phosphotransferase [Candidatus Woesearchaeota archaeon]